MPKERDDDAYFAPLADSRSPTERTFIGCVHHDDMGDASRLAAAQKYAQVDGIGSECGWGRADPDRVPAFTSHAKLLAEYS